MDMDHISQLDLYLFGSFVKFFYNFQTNFLLDSKWIRNSGKSRVSF
jgi:hypothetical protein